MVVGNAPYDAPRPSRAFVAFGDPLPPGYLTLADAARPKGFAALSAQLRPLAGSERRAALTVVHYAVAAVAETLLVWLLEDGVLLDLVPADVGLCLGKDGASTSWLRRCPESADEDAATAAGAVAWRLVGPVADAAAAVGRTPRRGTTLVALDALVRAVRRIGDEAGHRPDDEWLGRFAAGTGHPRHDVGRPMRVYPDAGPPVTVHVPPVCCMLAAAPGPHACPTCPRYANDEVRASHVVEMLGGLSDDDFKTETGRKRVGLAPGQPSNGRGD